jgi:trehalose synthase
MEEFLRGIDEARELFGGRVVWNVNSTARGGGVVELLRPLVGYGRSAGLDLRWLVIDGPPAFFDLTKRIHNRLHGSVGDGGALDEAARRLYEDVLATNLAGCVDRIRAADVVIVHDPQPAGLVPELAGTGATVIWRCHVGVDEPNEIARETWEFLLPYVARADAVVFSREAFAWDELDDGRIEIIPPTIDVFGPKNQELDFETVQGVLRASGLVADGGSEAATFERQDGTPGRIERKAHAVEDEPLRLDDPLVLQVSRWDALKDPLGVIRGFAEHSPSETGAHLVYAGPAVDGVADDRRPR